MCYTEISSDNYDRSLYDTITAEIPGVYERTSGR